jgi:hypothetical protein
MLEAVSMMGEAFYDATDITTEKSVKKISSSSPIYFKRGKQRKHKPLA